MKTKLILLIIILSAFKVDAQKAAIIKFDKKLHDFGQLKEEGGKVAVTFNFTNVGTDTLIISEAKPSCSCTVADWTKTPVAPGEKGFVIADYDPYNRPGEFHKAVWVNSNATEPQVTLDIKGVVIPRIKTFVDSFPAQSGNLYFGSKGFYLRTISNKGIKKDSMEVFNSSSKPMNISFSDVPAFITCKAVPTTVQPQKRGKIFISYNPEKKNDYGVVSDFITIATDDSIAPNKLMSVNATITDDFTKLSPKQKLNAPKIVFTSEVINYGTVTDGDMIKKTFEFKNEGKDTLFIRKTTPFKDDCKIILTGKSAVASGESSSIEIDFDTNGKSGPDVKRTILMTTNDPSRSFIILVIKGSITPK
ncbi:MAG: DUF1573 domain-containing protein [Bacteroidota bacterium]